jgi:hypothetical protein
MNFRGCIAAIVVGSGAFAVLPAAVKALPGAPPPFRLSSDLHHDTSPPLREALPKPVRPGSDREIERRIPSRIAGAPKPAAAPEDTLRQRAVGAAPPVPALFTFEGQSDDDNAAAVGFRIVPPDTNGDVGKDHYVQFINLIISVYDKKSGARIFGPAPGNSIWSGFGGVCETHNDGDPVVLYDHLADRWIVSQFAIAADGHQCVAVSATGDPTGAYHRYDFVVSPGAFNDYPKLGVWPDAYYLSANQYSKSFDGVIAVAFERSKMLDGQPARFVEFGPLPCAAECPFTLQPSHLAGAAPAAGTPNTYVMPFDDQLFGTGTKPDGYRLWAFHVDWANTANSTFTALGQLDTANFDSNMCQSNVHCITQPNPGERVDSLAAWTMYRAQYRTFRDHASLVVNHTVDVNGKNLAGIRWVELRNPGAGWSIYQTGTYAPDDGDHRWMGSLAMDRSGDIALGFSVSGDHTFPSIRYVTRTPDDPAGTFPGAESELLAGSGVQKSSFGRWGDYSSMSVDPVDGCTFWYTQEYYANTGSFDFKTRIGSFQIPGCGQGP